MIRALGSHVSLNLLIVTIGGKIQTDHRALGKPVVPHQVFSPHGLTLLPTACVRMAASNSAPSTLRSPGRLVPPYRDRARPCLRISAKSHRRIPTWDRAAAPPRDLESAVRCRDRRSLPSTAKRVDRGSCSWLSATLPP